MSSVSVYPVKLERRPPDKLAIRWSDGQVREYRYREILDQCPCATCREKRAAPQAAANPFAILKPAEAQPLELKDLRPVGNYAYVFEFTSGCSQGIFTLDVLRQLGHAVPG